MQRTFIEGEEYSNIKFNDGSLKVGDYEECVFNNCDFSETSLSGFAFSDCRFVECNLSLVRLGNTSFKGIKFIKSKLLGLHFEECNDVLFTVSFDSCSLNLSSFYKRRLKKTIFKNCSLNEVDFTEADLTGALFDNCDLSKALFQHTNLESADFRTSDNYSIDPDLNRIRKARFSLSGITGLLDKYDINIEV